MGENVCYLSRKTTDVIIGFIVTLVRKGDDDENSDWLGPRGIQIQRAN